MYAVFLGVLSSFCFGISNAYWKTASRELDYPFLVIMRSLFACIALGLLWAMAGHANNQTMGMPVQNASASDYAQAVLLCMFCSLGLIFYLSSLKYQSLSLTVALTSINIFSILTAVCVLGEPFYARYAVAFILVFAGVLFIQHIGWRSMRLAWNRGSAYALLASFFWGTGYPLFKWVSPTIGAIPLSFILEACVIITCLIWVSVAGKSLSNSVLFSSSCVKHYLILAGLLVAGTLSFNSAIQTLPVLMLNVIGYAQVLVALFIAFFFYRERPTPKQILGIALILLSLTVTLRSA